MRTPKVKLRVRKWFDRYSVFLFIAAIFATGFLVGVLTMLAASKPEDRIEASTITASEPKPEIVKTLVVCKEESKTEYEWIEFEATAYCSCHKCCGTWAKNRPVDELGNEVVIGASGIELKAGVSIATDWNVLPNGTTVEIQGFGYYIVQDKGGAIKGNRIDVYFSDHDKALVFGRQTVMVRVVDTGIQTGKAGE